MGAFLFCKKIRGKGGGIRVRFSAKSGLPRKKRSKIFIESFSFWRIRKNLRRAWRRRTRREKFYVAPRLAEIYYSCRGRFYELFTCLGFFQRRSNLGRADDK